MALVRRGRPGGHARLAVLRSWLRRRGPVRRRDQDRGRPPPAGMGPMTTDRKTAGHVNTQWPELPSDRHRKLLTLLRSRSHRDTAGRLVSWWPQAKLAAELGVSVRTLQNALA